MLRQYLLGHASRFRRTLLERGYFQSPRLYERLKLAEQDLVIAYVQGHLSTSDMVSFEREYATSPRRLRKIERARAFAQMAADGVNVVRSKSRVTLHVALAVGIAFVLLASPFLGYWRVHRVMVIEIQRSSANRAPNTNSSSSPYKIPWITSTVRFVAKPTDTAAFSYLLTLSQAGTVVQRAETAYTTEGRLHLDVPVSKLSTGVFDLTVQAKGTASAAEEFRFELRTP
jgi:hypothetical protein